MSTPLRAQIAGKKGTICPKPMQGPFSHAAQIIPTAKKIRFIVSSPLSKLSQTVVAAIVGCAVVNAVQVALAKGGHVLFTGSAAVPVGRIDTRAT